MKKVSINIINNLWWLIPLVIVLFFWTHASPIMLMLVFAYLGRVILNPVVSAVEEQGMSRGWAVLMVVLTLLILLTMLSVRLIPIIQDQIAAFQSELSMETLTKFQMKFIFILETILPSFLFNLLISALTNLDSSLTEIWSTGLSHIKSFLGGASTIAFALGSALLSFIILIVFMLFFLLEGNKLSKTFLHAVPGEHYGKTKLMLEKTSRQIHAYIRGQLLAAASVAITSIIGLYILQLITGISIPYTILIGISAGLFNLIPFAGPVMGMIPAVIIYLVTDQIMPISFLHVVLILLVFAIVQLIDNLLVSPYIMGGSMGLHPMLVIILVLFGASIGGILGMLFAVPIAAILKVIIGELQTSFNK